MDQFFNQKTCDRCGDSLEDNMMNTDFLCLECKKKEKEHSKYKEATEAELREVKRGN